MTQIQSLVSQQSTHRTKKGNPHLDKDIAGQIIADLRVAANALDKAEVTARGISDETESMDFRRALGTMGASLYSEVMYRIFEQYPELEQVYQLPLLAVFGTVA